MAKAERKIAAVDWDELAERALAGIAPTREEALAILQSDDDDLLALLHAAFRVRRRFHGRDVRLHVLRNAKSGLCRENCAFCSQAIGAYSGVQRYPMQTVEELVEGARKAYELGAVKYCMVTSTRGPSERELDVICEAVRRIKSEMNIKICTSLGILTEAQAVRLAAAGVDRFNHNLETSRAFFPKICQTHTFEDRVQTVKFAKAAGMEACCGGIMGMGETLEDRVDLAFTLRELEVESIPVNFLDPRPGTPLAHLEKMSPVEALKCLCMFRFVNPTRDIRIAGGREVVLRHMQPLALYPANSMFTEGYLTTGGQGYEKDMAMLREAGFKLAELVQE
ncbi:MAG: biotin synthase BioB [Kiritimatiellae bacterium]|nr:biotin synthase BioB [Kiritimatiellia bacterium]MDW8459066.1 biotin synthase BioB [Verrucomicrobiota bacterium]